MAAKTSVDNEAKAKGKPLLNVRWLAFAFTVFTVFYAWIRWYESVYGWSAGLDSFAPEFETYWMNFLYIEIVVEIVTASILWGYIWKTRDRNLAAITPREELRRNMTHLVWLFAYAWAIYWGASYFTEQDGTWHQTIVRDTDFTPSHIIEFYLSYPIYIITGGAAFLYSKTRLPFWSEGLSLPYLIAVTGPFMILPNVGLNEWGHTFWFMEELFVAPLHYGLLIFGWLALAILGVLLQVFASFSTLIGKEVLYGTTNLGITVAIPPENKSVRETHKAPERIFNIGLDFSRFPSGRHRKDSPYSGERLRDEFLLPIIQSNAHAIIKLDDARGYSSAFLEETFGGLVRKGLSKNKIWACLEFASEDQSLINEIKDYINNASERSL